MGQISYIDILGPFAQIYNKRRISQKFGLKIKQKILSAITLAYNRDYFNAIGIL